MTVCVFLLFTDVFSSSDYKHIAEACNAATESLIKINQPQTLCSNIADLRKKSIMLSGTLCMVKERDVAGC